MLFISPRLLIQKINPLRLPFVTIALALMTSFGFAGGVTALGSATASSSSNQTKIENIISRGTTEIDRRLTVLNGLSAKISSSTKLTATDQQTLSTDVSNEITGLTTLKTQLSGDTTLSAATADAQSIFTEYRVFALVYPQVALVRVADDQQVAESRLDTLITGLETRLTSSSPSNLQTDLSDMKTQVSNAQSISSSIESSVVGLQPSDYNTNHAVLSGDLSQLKTAQADIKAAEADAHTIISTLESSTNSAG